MVQASALPVKIKPVKCLGECERGPNLRIAPGEKFFYGLQPADLPEVVDFLKKLCADQVL
jgi:(2Fe-2S) ferredoxin